MLETITAQHWDQEFQEDVQNQAISQLENGSILFFPTLSFHLNDEEKTFLTPDYADPHAKNISYLAEQHKLWGVQHLNDQQHRQLKNMLDRYALYATNLVKHLLSAYAPHLLIARTSYRPVQVSDRKTSYRKDDKRLHVDAFPSAPNQGKRILRVFCNINPHDESRVWRVGEPFREVANKFLPKIKAPFLGRAALLRFLKITKSYRTLYDHYMLQMHNMMKADEDYQQRAQQQEIHFPPGSTWIVQTDHVSHAAMRGQYLLEQTFYLPVNAMHDQQQAPLRILESMLNRALV